jgi:RimJ/RimL family protein N-acetyltransferase
VVERGPNAPYRAMPRKVLTEGAFRASAVTPEHIEAIRLWRNAQLAVLRQSEPISTDQQIAYFRKRVWPGKTMAAPSEILLALHHEETLIGYGGLVHIAWHDSRAELSFLLDPAVPRSAAEYNQAFLAWIRLMQRMAFCDLGLRRLTTETYSTRLHHLPVLEMSGFRREGVLRAHVMIDGQPSDAILHGCLAVDLKKPEGIL